MKSETTRKVSLTAEEIKKKFGLKGEIVSFGAHQKAGSDKPDGRVVVFMLKMKEDDLK